MLRTSNQIRGVTHVIAGSIDVSWLVGALYQNTGIHISQIVRVCTTILHCSNGFFPIGQNHVSIGNTFRRITVSVVTA